jgi:hypothetical protein
MDAFDLIAQALTDSGYFHSRQPYLDGKERLVCVSHYTDGRLHGNSFWLTQRDGRSYVATWVPHFYTFPIDVTIDDICRFCIECLKRSRTPIYHVPADLVQEFRLHKIDYDEAERLGI